MTHLPKTRVLSLYDIQNNHKPKRFKFYESRHAFSNFIHKNNFEKQDKAVVENVMKVANEIKADKREEPSVLDVVDFTNETGQNNKFDKPHFWIKRKFCINEIMSLKNKIHEGNYKNKK
jgi:hypothetical protein